MYPCLYLNTVFLFAHFPLPSGNSKVIFSYIHKSLFQQCNLQYLTPNRHIIMQLIPKHLQSILGILFTAPCCDLDSSITGKSRCFLSLLATCHLGLFNCTITRLYCDFSGISKVVYNRKGWPFLLCGDPPNLWDQTCVLHLRGGFYMLSHQGSPPVPERFICI